MNAAYRASTMSLSFDESAAAALCRHVFQRVVRPVLLRHYPKIRCRVHIKTDGSPVTVVDRSIEAAIRRELRSAFPDIGIVGEEWQAEGLSKRYIWTIDPIDGTEAFIDGLPLFGTLLGVIEQT